jgi:hypothetical protein
MKNNQQFMQYDRLLNIYLIQQNYNTSLIYMLMGVKRILLCMEML